MTDQEIVPQSEQRAVIRVAVPTMIVNLFTADAKAFRMNRYAGLMKTKEYLQHCAQTRQAGEIQYSPAVKIEMVSEGPPLTMVHELIFHVLEELYLEQNPDFLSNRVHLTAKDLCLRMNRSKAESSYIGNLLMDLSNTQVNYTIRLKRSRKENRKKVTLMQSATDKDFLVKVRPIVTEAVIEERGKATREKKRVAYDVFLNDWHIDYLKNESQENPTNPSWYRLMDRKLYLKLYQSPTAIKLYLYLFYNAQRRRGKGYVSIRKFTMNFHTQFIPFAYDTEKTYAKKLAKRSITAVSEMFNTAERYLREAEVLRAPIKYERRGKEILLHLELAPNLLYPNLNSVVDLPDDELKLYGDLVSAGLDEPQAKKAMKQYDHTYLVERLENLYWLQQHKDGYLKNFGSDGKYLWLSIRDNWIDRDFQTVLDQRQKIAQSYAARREQALQERYGEYIQKRIDAYIEQMSPQEETDLYADAEERMLKNNNFLSTFKTDDSVYIRSIEGVARNIVRDERLTNLLSYEDWKQKEAAERGQLELPVNY